MHIIYLKLHMCVYTKLHVYVEIRKRRLLDIDCLHYVQHRWYANFTLSHSFPLSLSHSLSQTHTHTHGHMGILDNQQIPKRNANIRNDNSTIYCTYVYDRRIGRLKLKTWRFAKIFFNKISSTSMINYSKNNTCTMVSVNHCVDHDKSRRENNCKTLYNWNSIQIYIYILYIPTRV